MGVARLRAEDNLVARGASDIQPLTLSTRLTLCPSELRARVTEALDLADIPPGVYHDRAYAVVTRQPAARVFSGYTTYSVAPNGDLRMRSNTEPVVLLRRWLVLCQLGPGVLRVDFAPEARVIAIRPARARRRRPRYRLAESRIDREGNRALRAQLAELRRRRQEGAPA